jgi:ribonuclease M5
MRKVREVIVVEGRYDKNTLCQTLDAAVFPIGGFAVFNDREKLALLRRLAEERGLIVLTDSDGAGFVIRNFLKGALPRDRVKQAYIPDFYGKERRKRKAGKEGKLGVEGMRPEVLLSALERAGATFEGEDASAPAREPLTKADLYELGLTGGPGSAEKRRALMKRLALPEHLSASAMLDALNLLYGKAELLALLNAEP